MKERGSFLYIFVQQLRDTDRRILVVYYYKETLHCVELYNTRLSIMYCFCKIMKLSTNHQYVNYTG